MHKTRPLLLAALLAATAGCTPDWYKADADRQVRKIISDREQTTLDYKPQVKTYDTVDPKPSKKAYDKLPTTPIPPPIASPMEPVDVAVPFAPLGPSTDVYLTPQKDQPDDRSVDVSARRGPDRLRLGPPAPVNPEHRLDLFRTIEYAVQNSRQYQSEMEQLYLTALDVTLQRHLFEPRPFVTSSLRYTGGQRDVGYRSALTATEAAGVRQRLPYGGEVVAQGLVSFVDAIQGNAENAEDASVALSGSIPLLRGAGLINLEPLIASERQMVYTVRDFENFRRDFVVDISSRYFAVLTQQQRLYNRRLNYSNVANVTARTQALYEAGRQKYEEVQRSRQSLLSAESALVDAEEAYANALDNFKIQIGMPITQDLDIVPVEIDLKVPDARTQDVAAVATRYRLDLVTARDQIDDARRGVQNAKNGLLPDLNLTGESRAGNSANTPARYFNEDTATYSAGLTLDLPIDRLAERNAYRRSLINLQRAQRSYTQLQDSIIVSARNALRAISSAQMNLQIQQFGIDVALGRLENTNELLRQGKTTAREVLESQQSLLDAQDAYSNARAQLQISILQYLRETGTLRIDPAAGALGQAMDRAALERKDPALPH